MSQNAAICTFPPLKYIISLIITPFMVPTLLQHTDHCQYLGITIQSSNLKWDSHIHQKVTSANSTLGLLRRDIRVSSVDTKELAYKSSVKPKLEFAYFQQNSYG